MNFLPRLVRLSLPVLFFLLALPGTVARAGSPPVLAFYYAWFDQNTWTSNQSVDLPAEPYTSADPATIERHVRQARAAGIDALVQSWYGPQEANNQTETNFRRLLDTAAAQGLQAAVDVEVTGPFFANAADVTEALKTLLATHVQHPAYFRYQGQPVIFFWRQQRFTVDEWAAIRNQVDPQHQTLWIAEGVDIEYQAVFDGHHLYSIAWAASPADQLAKWGNRVRAYAAENGLRRLWVATAMPGYDDTRLPRADAFSVPRRNGDYYRETWQAAVDSQPDMIIITSFNEWLEGTQIEPGASYGNLYLDLTRELVTGLRGSAPSVQADPPLPPEPYIQTDTLTNVRSGPGLNFDKVGTLAADTAAAVTGQNEAGDWWQIEFAAAPGGTGWVAAEVVTLVGSADSIPVVSAAQAETTPAPPQPPADDGPQVTAPPGGVNVRSGPDVSFDRLGRLEEGQSAAVTGQNEAGDWWQIEFAAAPNGKGWVAAAVVDFSGDPRAVPVVPSAGENSTAVPAASTPTAVPTPQPVAQVEAVAPLNVRAEPSLDGTVVGGLYPGYTAEVLAVSPDGEWWQIVYPDGPDGTAWITSDPEAVRFEGNRADVPVFGQPTPTPTPAVTPTATPAPARPTPTPLQIPP
ncbi:MAG: hypothetical protein D6784_07320, partial [Chloroflexi bacterium]